jgi:putative DNA primase/helicase
MLWNSLPNELKQNALWCCWRLTEKGKIPFDTLTGDYAKSNNPSTFHSYSQALTVLSNYYAFGEDGKMVGGLGLGIFNGFSAIDIDNCIDENGKISDVAQEIIDYMQSYTETSPSGKGIRIIFKTNNVIDKNSYYINNRNIGLEIYISDNTNKFVTITGNAIFQSEIATVDISYILNKYMKKKNVAFLEKIDSSYDIEQLKNALKKDAKFNKLWNSIAPGSGANESELDLALCNKLAYYLNGNYNAIDENFRNSPYFASKDEAHKKKWIQRTDYRDSTIKAAISAVVNSKQTVIISEYELNDTGNAHRFIEKFGDRIRFNVNNKKWMIWNGKYWQHDVYNHVKNFAELMIEDMKQQALMVQSEEQRQMLIKNVKRALSSSGKEAFLKEAEHIEGIPCTNADFDKDQFLFNCEDGIINLKTGELIPHDKNLLISKISPIKFSNKKPEKFLKFLNEVFNEDEQLINYMHKIMGYSITGSTKEQCMFMLLGDGSNGKSVLLEILNKVAGSYGSVSEIEVLLEKNNKTANLGEIARLNGIRNVITSESQIGDKLNESRIKMMTSGIEKIVARFLYGDEFEFFPIFKIFMATNHRPIIRGTDNGIWRRIKIIPFNVIFENDKRDKELVFKLEKELPEILGWLVEGALKWQQEGLENPAAIDDSIKEYRSEMDLVQRWIDESCEINPSYREKATNLFQNLCNYVSINKEYQISNTMFGRNMSKKFEKKRFAGATYYLGIKLKDSLEYNINRKKYEEI